MCSPILSLSYSSGRCFILNFCIEDSKASDIQVISHMCMFPLHSSRPDTTLYASPMVSTWTNIVLVVSLWIFVCRISRNVPDWCTKTTASCYEIIFFSPGRKPYPIHILKHSHILICCETSTLTEVKCFVAFIMIANLQSHLCACFDFFAQIIRKKIGSQICYNLNVERATPIGKKQVFRQILSDFLQ